MLEYKCKECGHQKAIIRYDERGNMSTECLSCEHVEPLKDGMFYVSLIIED